MATTVGGQFLQAARDGKLGECMLLLDVGASVDTVSERGLKETALATAAREGRLDVVTLLLDHGASVHKADIFGCFPLRWAARRGHVAVGGLLLENGASDPTALRAAALKYRVACVQALLVALLPGGSAAEVHGRFV